MCNGVQVKGKAVGLIRVGDVRVVDEVLYLRGEETVETVSFFVRFQVTPALKRGVNGN